MSFHFVLQVSINVRILPEGCTSDVPLLMRQGFSSIHPALTRPWDLALLVGRVRHLMELVLLPVSTSLLLSGIALAEHVLCAHQ